MSNLVELKNCPWCGLQPRYTNGRMSDGNMIHILFCKGKKGHIHNIDFEGKTFNQAVERWNRRTP